MPIPPSEERILLRLIAVLEALPAVVKEAVKEISLDRMEQMGVNLRHEARIAALEQKAEKAEKVEEKTGQQSISDLREALKREQESRTHWTRYVIGLVVTVVGALTMLYLGHLLGRPPR